MPVRGRPAKALISELEREKDTLLAVGLAAGVV